MTAAPRRIHFWLPHTKIAGGTKISLRYAELLRARGHAVRVFAPRPGWRERLFGRGTWRGRFNVPVTFIGGWDEACRAGADVVVADSWHVAAALASCRTTERKFELIQHDERLYHGNPQMVERVYRDKSLKKIAVATWLKELFEREFGETPALVMNTLDRDEFYPVPGLRAAGKLRILLLAHTYPWKGTAEGMRMVAELKRSYPELVLVGFGVRVKDASPGFDEYHWNPSPDELRALYSSADIFLCPSWDEGFGLPSLEAMACGAALVTYDTGGSRDFAKDGETALVAPRKNEAALAAALMRLVKDTALRQKISDGGLAQVRALPTPEEQTALFESIIIS